MAKYQHQTKMVLWKVTEWKDDAVYKTKEIGKRWVPLNLTNIERNDLAKSLGGDFFGALSTRDSHEEQFRTIKVD